MIQPPPNFGIRPETPGRINHPKEYRHDGERINSDAGNWSSPVSWGINHWHNQTRKPKLIEKIGSGVSKKRLKWYNYFLLTFRTPQTTWGGIHRNHGRDWGVGGGTDSGGLPKAAEIFSWLSYMAFYARRSFPDLLVPVLCIQGSLVQSRYIPFEMAKPARKPMCFQLGRLSNCFMAAQWYMSY